ncbi:MAG: hypothetical protein NDJ89_13980 [Oligoflexia bacterium]|nr:hypothetical protein [Oligoflexia bacterium]
MKAIPLQEAGSPVSLVLSQFLGQTLSQFQRSCRSAEFLAFLTRLTEAFLGAFSKLPSFLTSLLAGGQPFLTGFALAELLTGFAPAELLTGLALAELLTGLALAELLTGLALAELLTGFALAELLTRLPDKVAFLPRLAFEVLRRFLTRLSARDRVIGGR